ncbi:MAG: PilZ domain-containing protein [Desulfobacterales bacterium]
MLYYITILIIFLVLGFAGIILFKKITHFQKQRKKLQEKESGFINELVTEADLKRSHYFQTDDFIENHTFIFEEPKNMENDKLGRNEVRAFIFEIINSMSDKEMRQLLKGLEARRNKEQRKYSRKDFLMITDYIVGDRYYRDFIQDISASGVFIKTSQKFSVGQTILMTFMSPDNQKPFRINGEIKHTHEDGIGVKFEIKSQVQELVLKSFVDMIQI